jgi:hypothetical protein
VKAGAVFWPPPGENDNARVAAGTGANTVRLGQENRIAPTTHSQAGKQLAVWLYNTNARTLRDTQSAFCAHPEWRNA